MAGGHWPRATRIKLKFNVRAARRKFNDADLMAAGKRGRKGGRGRGRKEGSPPLQKETPKLADLCKCCWSCGACGACGAGVSCGAGGDVSCRESLSQYPFPKASAAQAKKNSTAHFVK